MRRQALADFESEIVALGGLSDGRRQAVFSAPARLAKYVANGVLAQGEVRTGLLEAWRANGGASKHGERFAEGAIRRALELGRNDQLPPLARQFREGCT